MVTVNLQHLVLNDAADPSIVLSLKMLAGSQKGWPSGAWDEQYASGRVRLGGGLRPGRTWPVLLALMPLATAQYIQLRAGDPWWARDPLGNRVACWWEDPTYSEQGPVLLGGGMAAAIGTLTLREFTHEEVSS